ncbi:hypothetical protein [Streptomyces peucetius]|uniref:Uncharacterized protein n=1 Tax=Streptomyces peucetius TaxID=1950 RepID=A0ABY6I5P7_STRPE|nr:hypothetical protein [Streptomyces peucetius]UYQ62064.1 hypothetical protein OGH68_11560 [Streptomyces peucetius]
MTRKPHRVRRLVVDAETAWVWSVRHRHTRGPEGVGDCRTTLSFRREGTQRRLAIVFRQGPGRVVSGGWWQSGTVAAGDAWLNLHEPGAARRLLDTAAAAGLLPSRAGTTEVDGWPLLDAAAAKGPGGTGR